MKCKNGHTYKQMFEHIKKEFVVSPTVKLIAVKGLYKCPICGEEVIYTEDDFFSCLERLGREREPSNH